MIKNCLTLSLGLAAATLARAGTACTPLGDAASAAGLTSLVEAITTVAPALQGSMAGRAVLVAVAADEPLHDTVTVFAPTNDAFQVALTALVREDADTPEAVADVLLNHIVMGELNAEAILELVGQGGGSVIVKSLLGSDLFVSTVGDGLFLQSRGLEAPGAEVVVTDVSTCAGIVHVIDTVLLPTKLDGSEVKFPGEVPVDPPMEGCSSVAATATEAGLASLVSAITFAAPELGAVVDVVSATMALPEDSRFTIFAPTDDAFAAAAKAFGGALPDDEDVIASVLLNHIVMGELSAEAILEAVGEGGGSIVVHSLLGSDLFVSTVGKGLFLQSRGIEAPGAEVVVTDVATCAGIVHVIDAVLLPTTPKGAELNFKA